MISNQAIKILQLTDLHYMDGSETDQQTLRLMRNLIEWETPDLIVVSGDTVYGPDNLNQLEHALKPVTDSGIPWTINFGNHDAEDGEDKTVLFDKLITLPNCLLRDEAPGISGVGNHEIEIRDAEGRLRWVILMMDSGDYYPEPIGGYDYVKHDQIGWFKQQTEAHKSETTDYGVLVYVHIPLPEYEEVWTSGNAIGEKNEAVCCPKLNSGFFAAMVESGVVQAVYCGHDHINDYSGSLYGITLGYGRSSGYNTYGKEGFLRGARLIRLDPADTRSFDSWIRLEDGSVLRYDREA